MNINECHSIALPLVQRPVNQVNCVYSHEIEPFFRMAANDAENACRTVKPYARILQRALNDTETARRSVEAAHAKLFQIQAQFASAHLDLVRARENTTPNRMVPIEQEWDPDLGNFWRNLADTTGEVVDARHDELIAETSKPAPRPDMDHSDDFCLVMWGEKEFTFTTRQAACICLMWEMREQFPPQMAFLNWNTIVVRAAANYHKKTNLAPKELKGLESCSRFRDVFKDHKAWGTMIQRKGNNLFGLVAPPD